MKKLLIAAAILLAPIKAFSQQCPSCIQNSAAAQNAQINIGTATIRGSLTASTGTFTYLYISQLTASQFVGGGAGLTSLNASQLASGTVPSARVAGPYTSVTGLGTLTAGTWNANAIGTQYGGTGQNFVSVSAGSLVYFSGTGAMSTLLPGTPQALLQTNGSGAPVWTSAPAVSGANIYGINPAQLAAGKLPTDVIVSSNSIPYVDGASVHGVISSTAAYYTGPVLLSQLVAGTLPTSVAASSITPTGVAAGTYGSSTYSTQLVLAGDGRAYSATQLPILIGASSVTAGTFPLTVVLPLADLQAGTLPTSVAASSITPTGVVAGTYGGPSSIPQFTVGGDGRLTAITNLPFSGPISGTGTLGYDAIWASTYQVTSGLLLEKLSQVFVSTNSSIFLYGPNGRVVSQSSGTFSALFANGAGLTHLTAANVDAGYFGPNVIVSSVNVRAVGDLQLTTTSVVAGTKGTAARVPTLTVDAQGRVTALTDQIVAVTTGQVTGIWQTNQGGSGNDWSATAAGGLPYFSGVGALGVLPKSVNGYTLTLAAGVPVWSAASSSATHLSGGTAGAIPYQSAPSVTTFLTATVNGYALELVGGVPAWVAAVSSATNIAGGATNSLGYQSAANTTSMLAAGNGVLQEVSSGVPAWTLTPTLTGTNITSIPAASINAGTLGALVIASSVAATAVTAGSYGSASAVPTYTVGVDGRLTAASNVTIAIAESQVTNLTTDLAAKANLNGATFTGAVGLTNVALTATGANGNIISVASMTTTGGLFGGALSVGGTTISGSGALALASGQSITASGAAGYVLGSSSFSTTGGGFFGSLRDSSIASGTQCLHADASGNITGTGTDCSTTAGFVSTTSSPTVSGSWTFGNSGGPSTTTFNNIGAVGSSALGFFSLPLPTIYTSGCNTYTVPTSGGVSARKLDIDMSGGGAGGSAIATNGGVAGSSSTWIIAGSTIAANGGSGDGAGANGSGGTGGTGGQGGFGVWVSSSVARFPGSSGSACHSWAAPNNSGWGGSSAMGGGAGYSTTTGNNAAANSGGGGSGAGSSSSNCGAGGGGAEVVRLTILNPTGPYYVCVGAGGPGGAAGTTAGGNGGSGIVIIRPTF